ncbi:MAG: thiamine phosphate synthase [Streptosporangiales bacterium]|nr:thiamine phosphate synthase [Streptosporangiales bacterium]
MPRSSGSERAKRQARLADARLYLCTDARERQGDLEDFLDTVLANGVDIVQLRQKGLEARQEIEYLSTFRAASERHGALFAVNDRADLAYVVRPDILHLGQDDLPVAVAREILGEDILIGRSTHARAEVDEAAVAEGVDYFCVGPTWPTPTKPGRPAPGPELLAYAASVCAAGSGRPWFAIGGIDLDSLDGVLDRGARRAVVVRAITEAGDPGRAAAEFARRLHATAQ